MSSRHTRAAIYERELDEIEPRAPEAWAVYAAAGGSAL
jgi:hypothetical protein